MGQDPKKLVRVLFDDIEIFMSPEHARMIPDVPEPESSVAEPMKIIVFEGGKISREDIEEILNRR